MTSRIPNGQNNGLSFLKGLSSQQGATDAEALKQAKAEAKKKGKETFDLNRFASLFDLSDLKATYSAPGALERQLEKEYYLRYPNVNSMKDFAEKKVEQASF